jgi:hypothetical protein
MTLNDRAAKTTWEAHHPCGHRARRTAAFHDPSARRPSERVGYARRLDCSECWKAAGDVAAARERVTWLAGWSAEELAETEARETRAAMPALDGPERDCEWGRWVRHQLLAAAHGTLGLAEEAFAVRVEDPARHIDSASWWGWRSWSSQRDTEPGDLEELVTDAASIETATASGNPY